MSVFDFTLLGVLTLSNMGGEMFKVRYRRPEVTFPSDFLFYRILNFCLQARCDTIDLTDTSLLVDISDALSERDKVKFTVHTKVS